MRDIDKWEEDSIKRIWDSYQTPKPGLFRSRIALMRTFWLPVT
jgi:hypothetical protein